MHAIDSRTRLCAVIGSPVGHSLSPVIHNAAFAAAGLNYIYLAFEVDDVASCLSGMRSMPGFRGLSVTIPHKLTVMDHLDEIDAMALKVGSVNTVTNEDGRLRGSTTDGPGTLRAFEDAGVGLEGKKVLFLGSGGAARAVAFAVADLARPACITILGRTPRNVQALVSDLKAKTPASIASGDIGADVAEALASHDIVIQGTPIGMHPGPLGETCVPRESLRPEHVVFDMVYRPAKTRLVQDAEAAGCTIVPGVEMLLQQAALQFERWVGSAAPLEAMRQAVLAELEER